MDRILVSFMSFAAFFCLLLALELWKPRGKLPSPEARIRAVLFSVSFIPCAAVLVWLLRAAFGPLRFEPAFVIPGVLGLIVGAFVGDFFYYWFHRAQHSIPWLWRLHSVHHSIEELGAGAGYHHVTEAPLKALFYAAPLSLITTVPNAGLMGFLLGLHGNYIHSATRVNFGRFAWVIADNRTHRIHHSLEPMHFNKNFGGLTMIWDKLFRTAHFPRQSDWPNVGLADQPEPRTVGEFLLAPIRSNDPPSARR